MAVRCYTFAERPELAHSGIPPELVWPEYNLHGDVTTPYWPRLYSEFPAFQIGLFDADTDELLAEGHTVPCWWDGSVGGLPTGVDEALIEAFAAAGGPVNTLCAVAAEIPASGRGRGLAKTILQAMTAVADHAGLEHLIAPVRPSWKELYPITPIEQYASWRGDDGRLFDPWMRVHEGLGARVGPPLPESLRITGAVADWERWTGLAFPESGTYVFPQGLAPVTIDRAADFGTYWEPNVWMVHR